MAYEDDENGLGSLKNTIDTMFKRGNSDSAIKPKLLFTRRKQSSDKLDPFPSRSAPAGGLDKPPAMPPIPPRETKSNYNYGADEVLQPSSGSGSGPPPVPTRRKPSRNTFGTMPPAAPVKESRGRIKKTGSNNGSLFGSALLAPIKSSLTRRKKDKDKGNKLETGSKLSKDNESIASVESSLPPNFRYSRLSNSSKGNLPPIRVSSRQQLSYEEMEKSNEWKKTIRQNQNTTVGVRRQMGTTMNTGTLREQRDLEVHSAFDGELTAPISQEQEEPENNNTTRPAGIGSFFKKVFRR